MCFDHILCSYSDWKRGSMYGGMAYSSSAFAKNCFDLSDQPFKSQPRKKTARQARPRKQDYYWKYLITATNTVLTQVVNRPNRQPQSLQTWSWRADTIRFGFKAHSAKRFVCFFLSGGDQSFQVILLGTYHPHSQPLTNFIFLRVFECSTFVIVKQHSK